ncbi:MAG TPA: SH3 domain-containing protein [Pseudonocardiaceae bacterium]|nr:SH3 domain-containing protein [Pseudonocardiaceae bacterium]
MSKRMLIVIGVLIVVVVVFIIQSKNNPNGSSSNSGGTSTSSSGQCQMKVTNADVLNIRSSPDANASVVGKLQSGQVTSAQKTVQNGYRQLNTDQWVSAQFVTAVSGDC